MTPGASTSRQVDRRSAVAGTLAREHAQLMREVARRASPITTLLDTRAAWPHAELGTLATFLRVMVLRHVSDEETLLYPHDVAWREADRTVGVCYPG
jgi:predicted DNA-binding ribbon-helix-helix protein